jgi:AcrR family transcriptional regulator
MKRAFPREAGPNNKRSRTRTRLTEAALKVMSERGITAASVGEIAAAADMANGTFYLHFRNKTEIVAAVCSGVTLAMHTEMDSRRLAITDGAERVAFGTQQFVEIAADEPVWGRLLLSAFTEFDAIREDLSRYMRLDVQLGIEQGRFPEACDEFVIDCLLALLRTAIAARLAGAGRDVSARAAEYHLRILGMSPDEARRVRLASDKRVGEGDTAKKAKAVPHE